MASALVLTLAGIRAARAGMIWFGVIGAATGALIGALYASISESLDLGTIMASYPRELLLAFGLPSDIQLTGALPFHAFVAVEFFVWYAWALIVYALLAGAGQIAGEVERGTLDLVLALPLPRWRFALSRFLALGVVLFGTGMAAWVGVVAGAALAGVDTSVVGLLIASMQMALMALGVATFSLFLSAATLSVRATQIVVAALVVVMYVADFAAKYDNRFDGAGRLSIFRYFNPSQIVESGLPDWPATLIYAGIALAGLIAALAVFARRDIKL